MPGSGKTTFMLGLMKALGKRGMNVQPFKCGADCTDTQYHTIAAQCKSINLDTWMASGAHVQHIYNRYGDKADICMIEGQGGLFDGHDYIQGSSAELLHLFNIPAILVINARTAGYSIAPLLYGFKHFRSSVKIEGVVFNQVTSLAHYAHLKEACTDAGVECLGFLPVTKYTLPSPHQIGLTTSTKQAIDNYAEELAALIEQFVNIDRLLALSTRIFPCPYTLPYTSDAETEPICPYNQRKLNIAVAYDPAFSFVYHENLDCLKKTAQITYFSPIYGNNLPSADLVYLPGGFPELFARQLHRRKQLMRQLRDYVEAGGKLFAEDGGMVLMSHSLTIREKGTAYEMAGILPFDFTVTDTRLCQGYRKIKYNDVELKGYEFHYSMMDNPEHTIAANTIWDMKDMETNNCLYRYKNMIASCVHWYWGETDLLKLWD